MIPMPQVSREAINRLGEEMCNSDSCGADTLKRLKRENSKYAEFAQSCLTNIPTIKSKEEMQEFVRNIIAACYRLIELSNKYPDKAQMLADALLADPLQNENSSAIVFAEQETAEILQQYMLHTEK